MLILSLVLACGVVAQTNLPNRAQRQLDAAVEKYMRRDLQGAFEAVEEALETFPAFADAWMLKSQLHEARSEWVAAADALNQAIQSNPALTQKWREKRARLEFNAGRYAQALDLIDEVALGDSLLEASIRFAANAIQLPVELTLAPLEGSVNSAAPEYYPALYATSDRMIYPSNWRGRSYDGKEDFFEAALAEDGMECEARTGRNQHAGTKGHRPFAAMGAAYFYRLRRT